MGIEFSKRKEYSQNPINLCPPATSSRNCSARKRKLLYRRLSLFLVFAAVMSYLMITSFISQSSTLDKKVAQKRQLEQEMTQLKKQQQMLKEDIVKLNDDEYLAKLARKEYFFSETGEIIFNIPEENKGKNNQ
jgi:cell division protein DivIC